MLAITDRDVCTSCQAFVTPETQPALAQDAVPPASSEFQQTPQTFPAPAFPVPDNQYAPQTFQNRTGFTNSPPIMDARCARCKILIERGQTQCFDCQNRKSSSPFKSIAAFVVFAVAGYFGFNYFFANSSSHAIIRKFEQTTGADSSIVFENFTFSGDAQMTVSNVSTQQVLMGREPQNNQKAKPVTANFNFQMIYKKPNKSLIEMTAQDASGTYTAYKQAFDGVTGWKLTNIGNRLPRVETTEDAFAEKKMGMGLDEYDSVEEVTIKDENIINTYGLETLQFVSGFSTVYVEGSPVSCPKKTIILVKKKQNGKTDASLLFFDEKTGFLMAVVKKTEVNGTSVISKIFTDTYKKFPVKRKGTFGVEDMHILIPTSWTIETEPSEADQRLGNANLFVTINLHIKEVVIDSSVNDSAFAMPSS